jgi:hypothetical protein
MKSNVKVGITNCPSVSVNVKGIGKAGSHTAPGQSSADPKRAKSARRNANMAAGTKIC